MKQDMQELKQQLGNLDGKGYKGYHRIKGSYDMEGFTLFVDHVQGDPFAAPSAVRVWVEAAQAGFPADTFNNKSREIALRDFLARCFYSAANRYAKGRGTRGSGNSGDVTIQRPGQEILERSSVIVHSSWVEARIQVGLPAFGRRIAGQHAIAMFCRELPLIVAHSLFFENLDQGALYRHIKLNEDANQLREKLNGAGLVAFVANGSVLPRASGIDPRPLKGDYVIPFKSPPQFEKIFHLPNRGTVAGMGIARGITLIVGGGYHGKSTLLKAMEAGVYNHVPGDGRELVVTDPSAVKIRATDGRSVTRVNISPFINNLPFAGHGQSTEIFSTTNASGSTSQAANIMEAIEMGTTLLLIDEDTSATNFMIRDRRMQQLIAKESEPITPFIDKASQLSTQLGISTILVIGGSGDYFSIADRVIAMKNYLPVDLTAEALRIAQEEKTVRKSEGGGHFGSVTHRKPQKESFDPSKGRKAVKITVRDRRTIVFGEDTIDLSDLEQLPDNAQTRAIADSIYLATGFMSPDTTLKEVVTQVLAKLEQENFDVLNPIPSGQYAAFRPFELAGAVNRMRSVKFTTGPVKPDRGISSGE